jgi:hypothetical protein
MNRYDPCGLLYAQRQRDNRDWALIVCGVCCLAVAALLVWY